MKLYRFNEYSNDASNEIQVNFNDNETKYLRDTANLVIYDKEYYINFRQIWKLNTGEYYVPSTNMKCSTIQSLVKYTNESLKAAIDSVDAILKGSTKKIDFYDKETINWYIDKIIWATQSSTIFTIINKYYVDIIMKDSCLDSLRFRELVLDRLNKLFDYNLSHVKFL